MAHYDTITQAGESTSCFIIYVEPVLFTASESAESAKMDVMAKVMEIAAEQADEQRMRAATQRLFQV